VITLSAEAAADIERLHAWLLEHSARAAAFFETASATTLARIASRPSGFRLLSDGKTRRALFRLRRTSYHIDYRVLEAKIVIVRVWHGRRDRPH